MDGRDITNGLENTEPDIEHTNRDKERLILEDDTGIVAANAQKDLEVYK